MNQSPLQTTNTQSKQFSNLQPTTQFQSESTQPVALNPNQLDSNTTLTVVGPPSHSYLETPVPPGDAIWPFVVLAVLAVVSILGFVLFIFGGKKVTLPEEDGQQSNITKQTRPAQKKSRKKRKQR